MLLHHGDEPSISKITFLISLLLKRTINNDAVFIDKYVSTFSGFRR